ncbi:MAG: GDSL-type esterase/lipase family protein [Planctomycetota bacterium]
MKRNEHTVAQTRELSPKPSNSRRMRRRRIFAVLALLMGSVFSLIAAEVVMRIYVASRGWTANCYATGDVFFVPHDEAGYTLRPELRLKSTTYDVRVNSLGLRGDPWDSNSTNRPILVLGGSSVFGYLVPEKADSCYLAQAELASEGIERTVLNGGVPGFNMTQCRERFVADLKQLRPEIVILYLGWNDIRFLIEPEQSKLQRRPPAPSLAARLLATSTLYGFLRYRIFPPKNAVFAPPAGTATEATEAGKAAFLDELTSLISAVRNSGATPLLCTQVMAGSGGDHELDSFLGSTPGQIAANRSVAKWMTQAIRDLAVDQSVVLVDCAAGVPANSETLGDAIHLTKEGHLQVAKQWSEAIRDTLEGASDELAK